MLYPPVATQLPSNVSNSIRRFDFLERNNNTQGVNKHNISQHNSSSADVESLMTAGANISVVTANNAATLPYTASEDRASTGDDLSPSSVIKMDSSGTPIGVVTSDDCSGVMGESGSPTPPQTLTLRLIMQGKEVGSIIGKRGDTIKKFRTESGARINISDGQSIERIVTLTGASECLNKAFAMISYKFEEDMSEGLTADCPKPPVTLRLIVPASQCGSIIGKGGSKIKEIREHTGCTIQVAGDYLPQSTERAVTISGMPEAITKCIMEICKIMSESPPKGQTLPYRPKPISSMVAGSPIIANTHPAAAHHPFAAASPNFSSHAVAPGMTGNNFLTSAAYGIHPAHHAQFLPSTQNEIEAPITEENELEKPNVSSISELGDWSSVLGETELLTSSCFEFTEAELYLLQQEELAKLQAAQLSSLYGSFLQPATMMQLGASPLMGHAAATPLSPSSAGSASGGASHSSSTTQELNIPNDVIGCVIGPHGNRINDISSSSGSSSVAQEWHPTSSEPQPHPTAHSNLSATSHHFHQHQHHQAQHNIAAAAYLNNLAAYQSAAIYWPWFISAATAASAYQQHPPSFHIGGVTHYSPLTQVPSAASADTHISVHPLSSTTTTPITTSGSVQSGNSGNNQNSTQISSAPQQNSSGASIKISPMSENSGPNRVVTVTGTAEAVNNAWLQIATSLGLDPASLAAGMFSSSGNQAAVLSANPALAAAAGLSANQILAQLQLMNSGLPWASIASAVPSSSVSFSNPMMGLMSQAQAGNYSANYAHNPQVAAAVSSGSNLVNVMRPNFTNLKKARSEAAPY